MKNLEIVDIKTQSATIAFIIADLLLNYRKANPQVACNLFCSDLEDKTTLSHNACESIKSIALDHINYELSKSRNPLQFANGHRTNKRLRRSSWKCCQRRKD